MTKIFQTSAAIVLAVTVLFSCNQFKVTTDADGSKYQIFSSKDGNKKPKIGDIITFNLLIKADTMTFKNTYKEGQPISMPLQKGSFKGSFENTITHLAEGDSATVFVSADSLFGRLQKPLPPGVKSGEDLKFMVKIVKIQTQEDFAHEQNLKKDKETGIMQEYASKNMPNAQKTASGILFVVQKAGNGASPVKGDTVVVHYTGKFMDGKIFDTSAKTGQPITFPIGFNYVIPGWELALMQMKKGEKSTFFIPSSLAYGPQGIPGTIQPYTPLVFDMELMDIKKAAKR